MIEHLNCLIGTIEACEGRIACGNVGPNVHEVFKMTDLLRRFDVANDEASGLALFGEPL